MSVWELKIDPKRFREEIKNDIEIRKKKRDENKNIKSNMMRKKDSPSIARAARRQKRQGRWGGKGGSIMNDIWLISNFLNTP